MKLKILLTCVLVNLFLLPVAFAQSTYSSAGTIEVSPTQIILTYPYGDDGIEVVCPSLPLCQFGEPINTGKIDASGCKIYSCPAPTVICPAITCSVKDCQYGCETEASSGCLTGKCKSGPITCPSLPLCQFGEPINTGKIDANGCTIYSCPTAICPSLPLCQFGEPINTGKVDASGCKIYSCPAPTVICPAITCSVKECPYGCETDTSGCLTGKCKSGLIITCPQYSPPAPEWCKDGKIILGIMDKNGCQGQPQCVLPITVSEKPILLTEISTAESIINNISIEKISESRISIKEGAYSATSPSTFVVENSKIYMKTSEGNKEIKILPKEASAKVAAVIKVNTIELKEESQQPIYSVIGTKQAKLFYFMPVSMRVETKISAESGNVISVKKPWWNFLAR